MQGITSQTAALRNNHKPVAFVFVTALLAPTPVVFANSHEADLFFDREDNPHVVLSASKLKQSVNRAPASITVIDRQLIRESGARNIADIMYLVPGFQIGRHSNGDPTVTYHGQAIRNNAQLQLIIDGRPTYVPLFGGIPWSELPISVMDIERVEVTRAPNAATFGPNSFSAVISITTIDPAASNSYFINSESGGNSFWNFGVSKSDSILSTHYRLSLQTEGDQGYKATPDKERALVGNIHTSTQIDNNNQIEFFLGGVRGGHIEDDSVSGFYFYPYETINNHFAQFVWEKAQSTDNTFRLQYYYNYHDVHNAELFSFDGFEITGDPFFALTANHARLW